MSYKTLSGIKQIKIKKGESAETGGEWMEKAVEIIFGLNKLELWNDQFYHGDFESA